MILNVNPLTSISWDDFIKTHPSKSIALDGYVHGPPAYTKNGPYINFDHHYGVDRFATRSTCAQVLLSVRMGLLEKFENGQVFVNDCDEDVCLSWALLNRPEFAYTTTNPIVNKLVHLEDLIDSTSGMYPIHKNSHFLKEIGWIFSPYRDFRNSLDFSKRNANQFKNIIEIVTDRIYRYFVGKGETIEPDFRYEQLNYENGWIIIKEIGAQARIALWTIGIKKFISVGENGKYTIGKASIFIEPDFEILINKLNEIEKGWGGGSTIIGSPRTIEGSQLTIDQLMDVINEIN